ncbi:MAG TPA: amino acid ABC transporter substrate-binding protein [Roseiarcus sp.]|nr:amino acid ABC transporter substrate-binding protein [Roseiarcus sp.]
MRKVTRRQFGALAASVSAAALARPAFAQSSDGPIRIGYTLPLSGGLAGNGKPAFLAHRLWAEDLNAKSGLLGRKVELVNYDDQSNAAQVPALYTKLLDVDKVDLVVSSYSTALIAPAMPVVMAHGVAFVSLLGSATNDAFHYDRTVNISPTGGRMEEDFAKGYFKIAMTAEPTPKTVAIAGLDSDFLQRSMRSARKQAKDLGLEIVYDKSYPPGTVDYGPIVRAIQAAKPDVVYFASYPPDSVGLLKAVTEAKLTATVLGGGMIGPQITAIKAQFGPLLNNLVCWDSYAPEPTMKFPGVDAFLERYRAVAPKEKVDPLGLYAPPLAYAQMQVLEQAVSRVGKIDHAAIGADFHANTFSTVVGDLKFDANGEWEKERNIYVQYQGVTGNDIEQFKKAGTQVILYPDQYKSGKLLTPFPASS